MQQKTVKRPRRFRTVFISDVHLGFRGASADALLAFLTTCECETLYMAGDIIDIHALRRKRYWPQAHNDVLRAVLDKARAGTRVVYIPGNHDEMLRDFVGHRFGNIEIAEQVIHATADGRRLLVTHGDEFDTVVRSARWLGVLGGHLYGVLLALNHWVNVIRRRCGAPHWSLAAFLKSRVKNAVQYISRYEEAVAYAAVRAGVDGVVCGHIHRAQITRFEDIEYHNCGDWVESRTALVEHHDGAIEVVQWAEPLAAALPILAAA
ncbi:MAG: UDP-2,3-diacylglucosamine diphosphatase [Gammaproteobacteria bacterium]|nr:UDP-2,3-diacylglucosamine diphosphatase [Gammaproteobacteria bacterium]